MKRVFGMIAILGSIAPVYAGTNSVDVTCSMELSGNDVRHNLSTIDSLEKSYISRSFSLTPMSAIDMMARFDRVVPHADDANKYRHYQVAIFRNDGQSIKEFEEEGIPYARQQIKGVNIIKVGYGGPNEAGGDQVSVNVMGLTGGMKKIEKFPFNKSGKASFKVEYKVWFNYDDLGGDGIFGIFDGDVEPEDIEKAEKKLHKSKVVVKCDAFLDKIVADQDRDLEKEDVQPVVEVKDEKLSQYSESQIIRPKRASQE